MAGTWQVTSDAPDQYEFDAAGAPVLGHIIKFRTGDGATGSVFVPNDHYNVAFVRTQLAAQAAIADEVRALSDGA